MYRKYFLSAIFSFVTILATASSNNITALEWQVGYSDQLTDMPKKWVKATVPGAVQLDISAAEKYGPFYYAENWKDYLWMEDKFFTYKTSFTKPSLASDEQLWFMSKGIDYKFEIYLNGEKLLQQEGMFTPVTLNISQRLKEKNELKVIIYPVPKLHAFPADRSQAAQSVKPAASYGWDWHPRLVPSGIWDETGLEVRKQSHVNDVWVNYRLSDDFSNVEISVKLDGASLENCRISWQLIDADGKEVAKSESVAKADMVSLDTQLQKPQLWWPHDHGTPYLYTSKVLLFDKNGKLLESRTSHVGFRKVQLIMSEGAWDEPAGFPKGRSVAPIQVEINGRKIFAKGSNWVAPDIFPGVIDSSRYSQHLSRAIEANFNMLRIWGGCIVNKETFFEQCDRLGIMVWQEFPLACNNYVGTPEYLSVLKQESESIIKKVRKHPSLAMWCGGNELFNSWSGMTDQSTALRLLNAQCLSLDPNTPYINTSPLIGMAHGHYVFRDWENGEEVYARMARAHNTAYTDFAKGHPRNACFPHSRTGI